MTQLKNVNYALNKWHYHFLMTAFKRSSTNYWWEDLSRFLPYLTWLLENRNFYSQPSSYIFYMRVPTSFPPAGRVPLGYAYTIPYTSYAYPKTIAGRRVGLLFTHKKRWFRLDFCNGRKRRRADLESGSSWTYRLAFCYASSQSEKVWAGARIGTHF